MSQAKEHGFITEADVIETWPMIPATAIRRARRHGDLPFYQFPGGPHYRPRDVEAFIERTYRRGPPASQEPERSTPTPAEPSDGFTPARVVLPRPRGVEFVTVVSPAPEPRPPVTDKPETREEEIDLLRIEHYERTVANRPTRAQRKRAEAEAAEKAAKKARRGVGGRKPLRLP